MGISIKISKILENAAKKHLNQVFNSEMKSNTCCGAISMAAAGNCSVFDYCDAIDYFRECYVGYESLDTYDNYWWADFSIKSQNERFIALMFAAESAKSEGL